MSDPSPQSHKPYVPDDVTLPEFTWPAVLVGAVLGIVFGASSLYLVLKVGMTVSASIPVAVLSITLFRAFSRTFGVRKASILENNIVQTTGSAGESIAFGVGVTMPAVMILGFELEITRVLVVSVLGGLLGILMMIPLRRAFIVKQHGKLIYPEGTACADVLIVGETGGATAKTVFVGFGVAFVCQFIAAGFKLWKEVVSRPLDWFKGATPALEANPAMLGVGYIIGTKTACIMVAGGILQAFVLVPLIKFFGENVPGVLEPGKIPIGSMAADTIYSEYVKCIGAGAVAAGGIISLCRAMPLIISSIFSGLSDMRTSIGGRREVRRTDRDLPLRAVFFGAMILIGVIWIFLNVDPQTSGSQSVADMFGPYRLLTNVIAAVLIVLFGFLFVTVSSRLTGEIGSSSNPISGMTIATLLLTCLIFSMLGWTAPPYRLLALSVAAIVCIAASNGGTTSQDLKTGFLVGATPKWQQWAIVVGSVSSSIVIGAVLMAMDSSSTVYSTKNLPTLKQPVDMTTLKTSARQLYDPNGVQCYLWRPAEDNPQGVKPDRYLVDENGKICCRVDPGIAGKLTRRDDGTEVRKYNPPQASLFAMITTGILTRKLPWILVLLGVAIALVVELCGVSSLAFAVGVYLPLSSSSPIFVGGLARYVVERWGKKPGGKEPSELESEMSPGSLLSTGYIAGGTIACVVVAFLNFSDPIINTLSVWQYRTASVPAEGPYNEQCRFLASEELGPKASEKQVEAVTSEIAELNESQLRRYVQVSKGTTLDLPKNEKYSVPADAALSQVAEDALGSPDKASLLYNLNEARLKLPESLPPDATLRIPQTNWPALVAFGLMAVFLVSVGRGWLLKTDSGNSKT
jgi:putative OPT family oligopeptide transporter